MIGSILLSPTDSTRTQCQVREGGQNCDPAAHEGLPILVPILILLPILDEQEVDQHRGRREGALRA